MLVFRLTTLAVLGGIGASQGLYAQQQAGATPASAARAKALARSLAEEPV